MVLIAGLGFIIFGLAVHNGVLAGLGLFILVVSFFLRAPSGSRYVPLTGEPQYHRIACDQFVCTKCGTTWYRREVGIKVPECETCGRPRVRKTN